MIGVKIYILHTFFWIQVITHILFQGNLKARCMFLTRFLIGINVVTRNRLQGKGAETVKHWIPKLPRQENRQNPLNYF